MYYKINVDYKGKHFFSTDKKIVIQEKAEVAFKAIKSRFPQEDGFFVSCVAIQETGQEMTELFEKGGQENDYKD